MLHKLSSNSWYTGAHSVTTEHLLCGVNLIIQDKESILCGKKAILLNVEVVLAALVDELGGFVDWSDVQHLRGELGCRYNHDVILKYTARSFKTCSARLKEAQTAIDNLHDVYHSTLSQQTPVKLTSQMGRPALLLNVMTKL